VSYVINDTGSFKPRRKVDLARFAPDLAKALGGKSVVENIDRYSVEVDGFHIWIDTLWNDATKVTLHIRDADRQWLGSNEPSGDGYRMPSIKISVDRPMERLAADIKRRLIEPAREPAEKRREYVAKLNESAANLTLTADKLRKRFPGLTVRMEKDATHSGTVYHNSSGTPYLNGRFYADGKVSIDQLGSLSAAQFERVMKAIYETKK
jgi:hypothetical protein